MNQEWLERLAMTAALIILFYVIVHIPWSPDLPSGFELQTLR